MTGRRAVVLAIGLGYLYLTVMGFLTGLGVERMRFDARRAAVLSRLVVAQREVHARLMDLERETVIALRTGGSGRDGPTEKPGS